MKEALALSIILKKEVTICAVVGSAGGGVAEADQPIGQVIDLLHSSLFLGPALLLLLHLVFLNLNPD